MHTKSAAALCAAIASALMALGASTATARNFSLSHQNIRITFNNLEFDPGIAEPAICRITLEGSFHGRTTAKVAGSLIGYVTRVTTGQCSTGEVTILTETMPWHVRYQGFSGRLPSISQIIAKVFAASWRVSACLVRADIEFGAVRDLATGQMTGVNVPSQILPVSGLFCPVEQETIRSNGAGSSTVLGSTTRITVTLI